MAKEIHAGDIGTVFTVTILDDSGIVDISSATTKQIIMDPNGHAAASTFAADFVTDGTDGKLKYVSMDGDLDFEGQYRLQARVVMPTGTWSTNIYRFQVVPNVT